MRDRLGASLMVSDCALCQRPLHRAEVNGPWLDNTCADGASDGLEQYCGGTPGDPGPRHQAVHDLPDMTDREEVERWLAQ